MQHSTRPYVHRIARLLCILLLAWASSACVEVGLPAHGDTTHAPLWPIFGMHNDPALEDQQAQPLMREPADRMRYPPAETVSRDYRSTPKVYGDEAAKYDNPVPVTDASLQYGKVAYERACAVCHGKLGKGNGPVAKEMANGGAAVPSLVNDRVADFSDGHIYQVITHGTSTGKMWSYKSQLKPEERWAVVNYVRALQRVQYPEPWDRRALD
jgi:mono/diheme cytochrome c family protein